MVEEVRLLTARTLYSRFGDVIAYVAIALTAAALITVGRVPPRGPASRS
jgi:hypothetical protein